MKFFVTTNQETLKYLEKELNQRFGIENKEIEKFSNALIFNTKTKNAIKLALSSQLLENISLFINKQTTKKESKTQITKKTTTNKNAILKETQNSIKNEIKQIAEKTIDEAIIKNKKKIKKILKNNNIKTFRIDLHCEIKQNINQNYNEEKQKIDTFELTSELTKTLKITINKEIFNSKKKSIKIDFKNPDIIFKIILKAEQNQNNNQINRTIALIGISLFNRDLSKRYYRVFINKNSLNPIIASAFLIQSKIINELKENKLIQIRNSNEKKRNNLKEKKQEIKKNNRITIFDPLSKDGTLIIEAYHLIKNKPIRKYEIDELIKTFSLKNKRLLKKEKRKQQKKTEKRIWRKTEQRIQFYYSDPNFQNREATRKNLKTLNLSEIEQICQKKYLCFEEQFYYENDNNKNNKSNEENEEDNENNENNENNKFDYIITFLFLRKTTEEGFLENTFRRFNEITNKKIFLITNLDQNTIKKTINNSLIKNLKIDETESLDQGKQKMNCFVILKKSVQE